MSTYCTNTDVQDVLSEVGVINRTDDFPEDELDGAEVTAAIQAASSRIDAFLRRRYDTSDLSASTWVKWCCAYLSACLLSKRRGNPCPESIGAECAQYVEWLKEIRDGVMDVPEVSPAHDVLPAVSNLTVDARYARAKVRRVPATSTREAPPNTVKSNPAREWNNWFW